MTDDFSEENIRRSCPHCDPDSQAFRSPLTETENFRIVCDGHPIVEGHILIIPRSHLSCIGEYPDLLLDEFLRLDELVRGFLSDTYGSSAGFEHGVLGQTVFHSHVHYLPFAGSAEDIVPEGADKIRPVGGIGDLSELYQKDRGYLFFSIGGNKWTADPGVSAPRFFRDRFAAALGRPERGNWKVMHEDESVMREAASELRNTQEKWQRTLRMCR